MRIQFKDAVQLGIHVEPRRLFSCVYMVQSSRTDGYLVKKLRV